MEKYIKPECKIVEVKFEGNLMQASNIPPPDIRYRSRMERRSQRQPYARA